MAGATRRTAQRQQRGETRARIISAAEEELRRRPFREVSVEEVMEAAGLTRTLFYRHFDDLFGLVASVARPSFDDLYALHEGLVDGDLDADRLSEAIAPAVELFAQHGPLIRAVAEASSFDVEVEQLYRGALDRFAALTARYLERVGAPVSDPEQTARALTLMNVGYLLDCFGHDHRVTPDVATATIVEAWRAVSGS